MRRDDDAKEPCIPVVDDNGDAREAMVAILQMKGYCVASAENGRESGLLARCPASDLIITDLSMPVMETISSRTSSASCVDSGLQIERTWLLCIQPQRLERFVLVV
jgi:hypothetical protein